MTIDSIELVKKVSQHPFIYDLRTGRIVKEDPMNEAVRYCRNGFVDVGCGFRHHFLIGREDWNDFVEEVIGGEGKHTLEMINAECSCISEDNLQTLVAAIKQVILKPMGEFALHEKRSKIDPSLRIYQDYMQRRRECKTYGHRDVEWLVADVLGACNYCSASLRNYTKKPELKRIEYQGEKIERIVL